MLEFLTFLCTVCGFSNSSSSSSGKPLLFFSKVLILTFKFILLTMVILIRGVSIDLKREGSYCTTQKMKFSIKDFFSKRDQICRKLRIWSHLLKKSLMENFIFCAVSLTILLLEAETFFCSTTKENSHLNCRNFSVFVIIVRILKFD